MTTFGSPWDAIKQVNDILTLTQASLKELAVKLAEITNELTIQLMAMDARIVALEKMAAKPVKSSKPVKN